MGSCSQIRTQGSCLGSPYATSVLCCPPKFSLILEGKYLLLILFYRLLGSTFESVRHVDDAEGRLHQQLVLHRQTHHQLHAGSPTAVSSLFNSRLLLFVMA